MKFTKILPFFALVLLLPFASADLIYPPIEPVESAGTELFAVGVFLLIGFLLLALAVNFAINTAISFAIIKALKGEHKFEHVKMLVQSVIGLVVDIAAMTLSTPILWWGNPIAYALAVGVVVFIGVAISSYFLIFKNIFNGNKPYLASAIFGVISNPVWVLLAANAR